MNKFELFTRVMSMVSSCTGISSQHILTCKDEESTDARVVLVQVLSKYLSDVQIASVTNLTVRGVSYLRNIFSVRSRKWFVRSNYETITKQLGSN